VAAAEGYDECVQLMREAIALHVEGMREDGLPVPEPTAVASLILPAA
jgi:predicted RNase H-like HicB family nuclease